MCRQRDFVTLEGYSVRCWTFLQHRTNCLWWHSTIAELQQEGCIRGGWWCDHGCLHAMQDYAGQRFIVEVVRGGVVIGSAIGEVSGDDVAFEVCCRCCHIMHQCSCLQTML